MLRKNKQQTSFDRGQLEILNYAKGFSYRQISTLFNLSKNTVANILKRFTEDNRMKLIPQYGHPDLFFVKRQEDYY